MGQYLPIELRTSERRKSISSKVILAFFFNLLNMMPDAILPADDVLKRVLQAIGQ